MHGLDEMPGLEPDAVRVGLRLEILHLGHFHHVVGEVRAGAENARRGRHWGQKHRGLERTAIAFFGGRAGIRQQPTRSVPIAQHV